MAGLFVLPLMGGSWIAPGPSGSATANGGAEVVSVQIVTSDAPAITPAAVAGAVRAAHATGDTSGLLAYTAKIADRNDRRRLVAGVAAVAEMSEIRVEVQDRTAGAAELTVTGDCGATHCFRLVPGPDGAWRLAPADVDGG